MKLPIWTLGLCALLPLGALAVGTTDPWVSDGVVVSDDTWENMEVVELDDGTFRMYYNQVGSIYSATSAKGKNWTTEDGVRLAQGGPAVSVVKLSDSSLRMYFTREDESGAKALYSAISTDGLNFTEEDGVRLEAGHPKGYDAGIGISHPSVVQTYDGKWRVYYDTFDTSGEGDEPWRILSAVSDDGLNFTVESGIRIKPAQDLPEGTESVWSPYVRKKKGTYYLYVAAEYDSKPLTRNGIYVGTSTDGLDFTVKAEPLVFRDPDLGKAIDTDKGMNGAPQDPFVIQMNGKLRMYFWIVDKGLLRATYQL